MATSRLCSVEGCGKPRDARGYCKMHYKRWERGLPLDNEPIKKGRKKTAKGAPIDFILNVVMNHEDRDECLIWPFARGTGGYGLVTVAGKRLVASRYVCALAHGEPPSPDHHAAHSCNHGSAGCVNKHHLSWKTPSENSLDKIIDGTMVRGSDMHSAILDEDKVLVIREMKGKLSISRLARMFGVGHSTIQNAQSGKKWAWLE